MREENFHILSVFLNGEAVRIDGKETNEEKKAGLTPDVIHLNKTKGIFL